MLKCVKVWTSRFEEILWSHSNRNQGRNSSCTELFKNKPDTKIPAKSYNDSNTYENSQFFDSLPGFSPSGEIGDKELWKLSLILPATWYENGLICFRVWWEYGNVHSCRENCFEAFNKNQTNSKSITEPPVSYAEFSNTSKCDKQLQDNFCH